MVFFASHSNSQKVSYLGRKSGNALQKGLLWRLVNCRGTRGSETSGGTMKDLDKPILNPSYGSKALASILIFTPT